MLKLKLKRCGLGRKGKQEETRDRMRKGSSMGWWKDAEPEAGPLSPSSGGCPSVTLTKSLNFLGLPFK